jgi:hypothetical protein
MHAARNKLRLVSEYRTNLPERYFHDETTAAIHVSGVALQGYKHLPAQADVCAMTFHAYTRFVSFSHVLLFSQ